MRHGGFTLLELAVVVALIIGLIMLMILMFPSIGRSRIHARMMENSSRLRGIHQNFVIYATGNNSYYPGLDASGEAVDVTVEGRFQLLLEQDFFTPDYIISPQEVLTSWQPGQALTSANYSYAMLEVADAGPRLDEWKDTANSEAVILSDRNIGSDAHANAQSLWVTSLGWKGSVARNDNQVLIEPSQYIRSQYGEADAVQNDNLFVSGDGVTDGDTPSDAYLIHTAGSASGAD